MPHFARRGEPPDDFTTETKDIRVIVIDSLMGGELP